MAQISEMKRVVHMRRKQIERRLHRKEIIVALLGSSELIKRRRSLARRLKDADITPFLPEDNRSDELSPTFFEEAIFHGSDVDLIFINVESKGSQAEFHQFTANKRIAPKMRVLIDHRYHPLYGNSRSYLSDAYLSHEAIFGHTYAVDDDSHSFPTSPAVVMKLAIKYREMKFREEYLTR